MPQDPGVPVQVAPSSPPTDEANTESFFDNRVDPHCGHLVPFQSVERTSTSLSFLQASQ